MAAGDVVDIVVGSIPCEVSLSLSYPRSDIEETPCSLDSLLVKRCSSTKDRIPALWRVSWNRRILLPPDLKEKIALSQQGLFLALLMFSLLGYFDV